MLQHLFDWFVLWPADLVAEIVLIPIGLAPVVATVGTWFCTVSVLDNTNDGRPNQVSTFIIAGLLSLYVFAVTGTAVVRIPHAFELLTRDSD
jgi:hypothetical protein